MNKKLFIFGLLLLAIPACKRKRYATQPTPVITETTVAPQERAEYDEELGAFVVKDDENKFSAATAAQANQEEQLTAESTEPTTSDLHDDSAKYGLKPIFFEFDKYRLQDLRADQRPILEHDAEIVKSLLDKGYRITIDGYTDSFGTTDYNMVLSERRAETILAYLKHKGIEGDIRTVGRGSVDLIIPEGTPEQQAPNRRAVIYAYGPESSN